MKPGGWVLLLLSWGAILALTIYCFYRVFHKDSGLDSSTKK
ncbi:MAG: hypothetical protein V1727_04285 [Candidatus Omnitrophota bacterium]